MKRKKPMPEGVYDGAKEEEVESPSNISSSRSPGPRALPTPKKRRTQPEKRSSAADVAGNNEDESEDGEKSAALSLLSVHRKLPEDPAELDAAIAPMKVMVRPILHGISRIASHVGASPLDKDETDSGTIAWSALLYQQGGMLDARVLVLMWTLGVSIPRTLEYFENKKKREEEEKRKALGMPALPEVRAA